MHMQKLLRILHTAHAKVQLRQMNPNIRTMQWGTIWNFKGMVGLYMQ